MIFILGGHGFVGSAFVRLLEKQQIPYKVITRENYENCIGSSCDLLINANGNSKKYLGHQDPKWEFQASVVSVRNSLEDFNYQKYVFLSTSDVYADCSNPTSTLEDSSPSVSDLSTYGFHKYLAEQCVQHVASDWLIVRMGGFVGPGLKKNAVYDLLNDQPLWVHPQSEFQLIHSDDSAQLIMSLIEKNYSNEIFNLTAKNTISVEAISKLAGKSIDEKNEATPVRYELSTAKVEQYLNLPDSETCVIKFIQEAI